MAGSSYTRPSAPPSTWADIFWCTCLGGGENSEKNVLLKVLAISGNSKIFFVYLKGSMSHQFFVCWNPFIFCEFGGHAKFQNPVATPFGRKVTTGVLAPHLRMLDRSAHPPIDTFGNVSAHMSAKSPSSSAVRSLSCTHCSGYAVHGYVCTQD